MRASKYNPTTRAKLLMYISDGRTVKDACFFVGISDMTLARWRKRYPDFDEEYLKAVESQWQSIDAIKKSGARTYRRNSVKLRQKAEKQAKIQKMTDLENLTLNSISYEWLEKTNNPKLLKKAIRLLKEDGGYFPDLENAIATI